MNGKYGQIAVSQGEVAHTKIFGGKEYAKKP